MSRTMSSTAQQAFDAFASSVPSDVDVEAIRQEWQAVRPHYLLTDRHLPLPIWARRGFTETGEQAWVLLKREVGRIDRLHPFCIYVHLPFCASKCPFCDCYSFALRRHQARHIDGYLNLLAQETALWSQLGSLARRPVSTVHFGGGNPTFLGERSLSRAVHHLKDCFGTDAQTEWALESTTSELSDDMFSGLAALGFTRLHLGVQTLEDPVRRTIGRREPASTVLEKLGKAVGLGWVVSVDLIFGLPDQTPPGLLGDIKVLAEAGVDGFSLYELQMSPRNQRFAQERDLCGQERAGNYFLFQAASRLLISLGYRKTLFNHFARERDTNLYFTFPQRGEDCLAIGTIADGVFGDYQYRHPEFKHYRRAVSSVFPGLQGGLRRTSTENRLSALETDLLGNTILSQRFVESLGEARADYLLRRWRELALVEDASIPGWLQLTANGSWFVSQMMEEIG